MFARLIRSIDDLTRAVARHGRKVDENTAAQVRLAAATERLADVVEEATREPVPAWATWKQGTPVPETEVGR